MNDFSTKFWTVFSMISALFLLFFMFMLAKEVIENGVSNEDCCCVEQKGGLE